MAGVLWRGAEKPHLPGRPRVPRMSAQPTPQGQGPSWGAAGALAPQLSAALPRRSEEVNWAAWEQTLPTVREEPAGPGDPGE